MEPSNKKIGNAYILRNLAGLTIFVFCGIAVCSFKGGDYLKLVPKHVQLSAPSPVRSYIDSSDKILLRGSLWTLFTFGHSVDTFYLIIYLCM